VYQSGSGFHGSDSQKLKKKLQLKKDLILYLILGFYKERPSYRRSLQPLKENIQHFYFSKHEISSFFLFLSSGTFDLIEYGSHPAPEHFLQPTLPRGGGGGAQLPNVPLPFLSHLSLKFIEENFRLLYFVFKCCQKHVFPVL
jgi:hypothetical protein